ncbi:hypothetical protein M9Y10_027391 [Tritrichomonas musculus]|uniref:BEACH domain-containing protein n=1 Tax=Tritrichomonas musculus TaxID=1915356 RepID=A0ABR2H5V3_9EUKA
MFNIVKGIFRSQSNSGKNTAKGYNKDISDFEENLNQIDNLPSSDQVTNFLLLSANFVNTFSSLNSNQVKSEQIFPIYQKYLKYVTDFSDIIFEEKNGEYEYIFKNLKLIGHQLGSIPDSVKFVQFFYLVLRTAKNGDIQCLKSSSSFSVFLFRDESFFRDFSIEMDGLTSIFTSFFITNNKEAINYLTELLFQVVPSTYYKTPSQTTLAVCKDAMNSQNCPECAYFLCNYLALLSANCSEDVLEGFYKEDGFTCLNHFLVTYCDKTAIKQCYEILLLKKGKPKKTSLKALFEIYSVIPDNQEIALEILNSLQTDDIQKLVPIHYWVLNEDVMKEESILTIVAIMLKIGIVSYVANIFAIIEKCPKYKRYFLELIFVSLNEKGLDPENLVEPRKINYPKSTNSKISTKADNSFLSRFVLRSKADQLKDSLLNDSKYFKEILIAAYSCPKSAKIREEVISKIIHIYNTEELSDLIIQMLQVEITCEMFILLLSNFLNPLICNLFIYMIENHLCPFEYEYFVTQNGFSSFNVLLEDKKDKEDQSFFMNFIITALGLITKNGPKNEIDEWILSLPNDSILFNEEYHENLAKIAINESTLFLNIPSLLLFSVLIYNNKKEEPKGPLFDLTSPICLYNAGKYGIPMFSKRNMKIVDSVPFYNVIVNRYINPTIYNEISEDFDHYPSFINTSDVDQYLKGYKLPNFELFELYFSGSDDSDPSITFKDIERNCSSLNQIRSVEFRFFVPSKYEDPRVSIFRSSILNIQYFKGILTFQTHNRHDSTNVIINKDNIFVHVKLIFNAGKAIVKVAVEPIDPTIVNSNNEYTIKPYEKVLDIDQAFPTVVTFGGRYSNAKNDQETGENELSPYRLIFDRYIFINNRLALLENSNGSAYKVPYSSFYSYIMKDRARIESMFLKLEEHKNTQHFTPLYISILLMIKYLKRELYDDSPSNNPISFSLYITEVNSNACTGFADIISKEYLFSRLLFSLKRCVSSISSNILVYLHQLPYSYLDEEDFADFTYITLIDFEIYFLFDKQLMLSYLNLVKNDISDSKLLVNKLIEYKTTMFLIAVIKRSDEILHISDEILKMIYTILINIGSEQNACLYKLINESVIVSYWKFHFVIESFPIQSVMELQQVESPLQVSFLNTVKRILKSLKEPKLQLQYFVQYSLFFNDERSLVFFEIIAHYSYYIPHYIDLDKCPYLSYAFARFADNEKAWLIAFTILGGYQELLTEFPKTLQIRMTKFSPVILIMLIRLLSLQALSVLKGDDKIENEELADKVFTSLMSIQLTDFVYFSTDLKLISLLSNFGIIPKSILLSFDDNVRTPIKLNDEPVKMSSIDLSYYKDLDFFKEPELLNSTIEITKLPDFADDLVNTEWVNLLDFTRLISFITKIILSTDFSIFGSIAVGNALMYTPYQKLFAKELIFSILTHFQNVNKNESSFKKSIGNFMNVVSIAARCSIFADCYLKFLDKVIAFIKTWCYSKSQDQSYYSKELRDIVLYSLTFITNEKEIQERNKLLTANKDLLYNHQMNENADYATIVNFYIFMSPKDAQRQSNATQIVEKFSQIEAMISKHFRINEFASYSNISLSPMSSLASLFSSTMTVSAIPISGSVRVQNAKKILEWAEHFLLNTSRINLYVRAMKAAYLYQSTLYQFDHIQIYCRVLEQKLFKCIKDEYMYKQNYLPFKINKKKPSQNIENETNKTTENETNKTTENETNKTTENENNKTTENENNKTTENENNNVVDENNKTVVDDESADNVCGVKSFYLSQICEPYYSPRNVCPSPFEILMPPTDEKVSDQSIFKPNKNLEISSKIEYVDFFGHLMFPYQWCQDLSIFKHSYVFTPEGANNEDNSFFNIKSLIDPKNNAFKFATSNTSKEVRKTILRDFIKIFGTFSLCFEVDLIFYVHTIPTLLFVQEDKIILLLLSTKQNFLVKQYEHPLLLIPLSQEILLNEYHDTSIFCGHYVLTFQDRRLVKYDEHYYLHEKRSLSLFYIYDPNIVLVFKSTKELELILSKKFNVINRYSNNTLIHNNENFYNHDNYNLNLSIHNFNITQLQSHKKTNNNNNGSYVYYSYIQSLPRSSFFMIATPIKEIILFWLEHEISSFDYLIYLNMLGCRSFVDLSQYPVFPWICALIQNHLKIRDLTKPMGQLSSERAKHFDDIYEGLKEGYFYGCHYSNPGIILWYLMRMPPFNYLTWELNNGWDAQSRTFRSFTNAYISASTLNPTDVKELVPEIYSIPMSLTNESNLNCRPGNVKLPTTEDNLELSSSLFVSVNRKFLEEASNLNDWIDLIFGYKQKGEEALKCKNIFLPTSYHDSTPETTSMDKKVFKDHVNNFGQCPKQLFETIYHPSRTVRITKTVEDFSRSLKVQVPYGAYCFYQMFFVLNKVNIFEKRSTNVHSISKSRPGSLKKRIIQTIVGKNETKKDALNEPNSFYSFYLTLNSSQLNDPYFLRSGIDECTRFIHFNTNEKKDGMNVASGQIEIRWKLINTDGLIVPIQSIPIIPNGIEKYIDQSLIDSQSNENWMFPFNLSSYIFSQPVEQNLEGCSFVVNYESDEVLTIRKINNSINNNLTKIFNSTDNIENIQPSQFNSSSELIAVYKDNDGHHLNHFSISDNGAYVVASYDNGLAKVLRIDYEKSIPQRIRLIATFSQNSEILLSKISTRDMIVFSVTNNGKLVIWSYATRLKQREFDLELGEKSVIRETDHKLMDNNCSRCCDVVDVINDDFDGCVTVLLIDKILQFETNGTSVLRRFVLNNCERKDLVYFTSIALYPLDFTFDKRVLVVGDNLGSIYFFAVAVPLLGEIDTDSVAISGEDYKEISDSIDNEINENKDNDESKANNGELKLMGIHKGLLRAAVSSIFIDREAQAIIANDQRGGSIIIKMDSFLIFDKIERCEKCLNEKTEHCKNCGKPICPVCSVLGLCSYCKENAVNAY